MASLRLRALVLAAGRGERLRPLTDVVPKALLPVAGMPVAGHTLARLAAAGCEAAALNLHHLGGAIRARFGDRFAGMPLVYSEEAEPLGTLGALGPLRSFFAGADLVVVVNGDSLCRWPIERLVRRHLARRAAATLLFARRADPREFGGGVAVGAGGRVLSFAPAPPAGAGERDRAGGAVGAAAHPPGRSAARAGEPAEKRPQVRRWVFAGAQVLSPELVARVEAVPADTVRDLYAPLLAAGERLQAVLTRRRWHDLGTPRRYLEAALDWGRGGPPGRLWRRTWIAPGAVVARGAAAARAVVEPAARIEAGAQLERAVVLPGARVASGCWLRDTVVGPGAALPPGTRVERRLVTAAREGVAPAADESRVGGLVYTPFERAAAGEGAR
jgi:NDP-sugar pyrophosphorylase family protein